MSALQAPLLHTGDAATPDARDRPSQRSSWRWRRQRRLSSTPCAWQATGAAPAAVKACLLGDTAVGKSTLVHRYARPSSGEPPSRTACDIFRVSLAMAQGGAGAAHRDGIPVALSVQDVGGSEACYPLQRLASAAADVCVLCFDVARRRSFDSIALKWLPLVQRDAPAAKVLLVGLKRDQRRDVRVLSNLKQTGQTLVTEHEGRQLARLLGCHGYTECSVFDTPDCPAGDLKSVFDLAIALALDLPTATTAPGRATTTITTTTSRMSSCARGFCRCLRPRARAAAAAGRSLWRGLFGCCFGGSSSPDCRPSPSPSGREWHGRRGASGGRPGYAALPQVDGA